MKIEIDADRIIGAVNMESSLFLVLTPYSEGIYQQFSDTIFESLCNWSVS